MIEQAAIEIIRAAKTNCFRENNSCFSETRDVFTARMQSYIIETKKYLEAAIIGEIGNNTFDHNFMFANNCPKGVYCDTTYQQKYVVIADYGKGIRRSLSPAVPSINSEDNLGITFFEAPIAVTGCLAVINFNGG